jgi:hypothetical protein
MLDFDLAELYETETKYLKRAVKHNLRRFPSDFMFELSKQEFETLRCNFSTSNKRGGIRYMPFAFTEQGVAMLSAVLNSQKAIDVNISIMRAFVSIRQLSLCNTELRNAFEKLAKQTKNNTKNIELVFQYLDELMEKNEKPTKKNRVGYKHYD